MRAPLALRIQSLEDRAVPAVTTSFDVVAGRLTVRSDAADAIAVSTVGPAGTQAVTVNGRRVTASAADVKVLQVRGGPGANRISLGAVTPARFPALTTVLVDGGAGADRVIGSAFGDDILGGPGRDALFGGLGNDTLRGGGDLDLLDGGFGDDVLNSSDPVTAGFNDAVGLNANPTANSPYQIGGILFGHGQGEAGWGEGWQHPGGQQSNAVVQSDIAFEGDGALHILGGTTTVERRIANPVSAGVVTVSQMIYIPAGGGIAQYLMDGTNGDVATSTAAQWTAGAGNTFQVLDGGTWEDTGVTVPVQEWFRIDAQLNLTDRSYNFYINGLQYVSPDPLGFRGNPGAFSDVRYFVEGTSGGYIDALEVDGPDALTPSTRGDTLRGGFGNDSLRGAGFPDLLQGGEGNDSLFGGGGNDNLQGGNGADRLDGESGADLLLGAADDDSLFGAEGNDRLLGQTGNDQLDGGRGDDNLNGGFGDDSLDGSAGNDTLLGDFGDDTLLGGTGNDSLGDRFGDDTLSGGGGADRLDGGPGDDLVESGDPELPPGVRSGFNDAEGINADGTTGSPYALDSDADGSGVGEPGWAGGWSRTTGDSSHTRIQSDIVHEGDGALRIFGGTQQIVRRWADPVSTGIVAVSQWVYAPAGSGAGGYVQDATGNNADEITASQWAGGAGGTFSVLDSGIWEDTGIAFPAETWTKIEFRIDMDAKTYEFFVNDVPYAAPDPIGFRGNPGAVGKVNYLCENLLGFYIDAVSIGGPDAGAEPITFGDTLYGGAGKDTVRGSRGNDLLLGGLGDDSLDGGLGRDVLIGGKGADLLLGGDGSDLLVGGFTRWDANALAFDGIVAEWNSTRTAAERFANVTGTGSGTRANGAYFLKVGRAFADASRDTLTGAAEIDGFVFRASEDDSDLTGADLSIGV